MVACRCEWVKKLFYILEDSFRFRFSRPPLHGSARQLQNLISLGFVSHQLLGEPTSCLPSGRGQPLRTESSIYPPGRTRSTTISCSSHWIQSYPKGRLRRWRWFYLSIQLFLLVPFPCSQFPSISHRMFGSQIFQRLLGSTFWRLQYFPTLDCSESHIALFC